MGLLAGYFRGWVDTVVSRLIEIVMVFPFLLFIIADPRRGREHAEPDHLRLPARPGVFTLALIFSVFGWFYPARIIRGVVLSLREKEFVEAARMTGASDFRIMRSHLLPHLVAPIIVYSTLIIASNIIAEAGLSFLGLGIEQPTASWGNLLAAAPDYYLTQPWLMVWPGLFILLTTFAFNLLGDGLRDAFDPRARDLETPERSRSSPTDELTIRARQRRSRKLVFCNSPVTMRRRSSGASGSVRGRGRSHMRKKQMLSLFMLVLGVALLVAATTVGAATSATQRTGKAGVTKGGTLRVNEANAGLRLRRSAARLPHRRLGDALHDCDAARELPGEGGCRRQPVVPAGRDGLPDRLEGREDLHVHDPFGPEVQ